MSETDYSSSVKLNECRCCEGTRTLTPTSIENPPGLTYIRYR